MTDWTATGKQFAVPYVFKTLFSKEPIEFEDICETFSVTKGDLYLDRDENLGEDEHDYHFVGRVGQFCPIAPGRNGGILWRKQDDKYFAPPGTLKDPKKKIQYRWLESEMVKTLGKEGDIDRSFYDKLVNDAVDTISKYGDFEWFVSDTIEDEPLNEFQKITELGALSVEACESLPWKTACGKDSCYGCPNFYQNNFHVECTAGHDISDLQSVFADLEKDQSNDFIKR